MGEIKKVLHHAENTISTAASDIKQDAVKIKRSIFRDIKDNVSYAKYITRHKANIIRPMMDMEMPLSMALKHDLSKYSPKEFVPYRNYFEGPAGKNGTNDPQVYSAWRQAVKKHYNNPNNLHHYTKIHKDPSTVSMDNKLERVADWYSVQKTNRTTGAFPSFKSWYKRREASLPIEPAVRQEIDARLRIKQAAYINKIITNG